MSTQTAKMRVGTVDVNFPLNYMEGTIVRDGLRDILTREREPVARAVDGWLQQGLDQLYLVGCGGSLATMEPPKWLLDRYASVPVDRYSGWEFVHRAPARLGPRSALVAASHSGTTEEVLRSLDLAKARGAATMSFSVLDSPVSQRADVAITYSSPAVNLSKLLMGYLVTAEIISQVGDQIAGQELYATLETLPDTFQAAKEATEPYGRQLAAQYKDADGYYVVGTGLLAGLAYQFTICSLIEMQWLNAATINAAEFRHGPYEIVRPGVPMIFLLGQDESRPVVEQALDFARRYGADTIVMDLADTPGIHPWLAPFGVHPPLQWFLWYLSVERNHPISTRRYMGKVPY